MLSTHDPSPYDKMGHQIGSECYSKVCNYFFFAIRTTFEIHHHRYKVSFLALIPSIVHQLVHYPGIEKADFSSINTVGSGAAYLPPELGAKMTSLIPGQSKFVDGSVISYVLSNGRILTYIFSGRVRYVGSGKYFSLRIPYVLSLCIKTFGAIMQPLSGMLGGKLQRIPGCAGVLCAGMEARIVRDDGTEADFNEVGELWLRGKNVSIGYWNNTKATTETFVDGWLRTGDQFRIDEKENFW